MGATSAHDAGVAQIASVLKKNATRRMNTIPKYVVSTTMKNPDWANTTVISNDAVAEIRKLKEQPGQAIVQYGFGAVSALLMKNDLLDEIRLWFHPCSLARARATTAR
jgi:dihydrofolate reductase